MISRKILSSSAVKFSIFHTSCHSWFKPSFSLLSFNLFVSLANKKTDFTDVDPHSNDGSLRWTRLLTTTDNASICSPINDEVCDEMVLDDDATNVSDFWSSMALLSHVTRLLIFIIYPWILWNRYFRQNSKHSQIKLLFRNLHESFEKNLLQFSDGYLHVI